MIHIFMARRRWGQIADHSVKNRGKEAQTERIHGQDILLPEDYPRRQVNTQRLQVNSHHQPLRTHLIAQVLQPGAGSTAQIQDPLPRSEESVFLVYLRQFIDRPGRKLLLLCPPAVIIRSVPSRRHGILKKNWYNNALYHTFPEPCNPRPTGGRISSAKVTQSRYPVTIGADCMSFLSWQFPFFLLGFVLIYWQLPHRPRLWFLLVGSYTFYACWDVRFLALVFTTTVVDYLCARGIAGERLSWTGLVPIAALPVAWLAAIAWLWPGAGVDAPVLAAALAATGLFLVGYTVVWRLAPEARRRAFLLLSLGFCLAILAFFKYCNFFINSAAEVLAWLGLAPDWPTLEIILPVGISFYTFQSLGYVIDVYRGEGPLCRDFLIFAVFDAYFPQMVAGPIERGRTLLPQLSADLPFRTEDLHEGLRRILVGFFKKVYVADNCALLANYVFTPGTALNAPWAILGGLAFAFQIYGDFSGYTDIARGAAKLLGVELVHNFRFPYLARNPSDFWSRWHISLSTWFRDYVYIPLGGNRGTAWQTARNLLLTMLLAGLWHGAAWTFVIWGAYHGVLLLLYRFGPLTGLNRRHYDSPWLSAAALALMAVFTLVGWAIFRSPTLGHFWIWLTALGHWEAGALPWRTSLAWLAVHIAPLCLLQVLTRQAGDETELAGMPWPARGVMYLLMLILVVSSTAQDQEFIYFQF